MDLHYQYFHNHQFFYCHVISIIDANIFVGFIVYFYQDWIKVFNINYIIKNVICMVFNINLLNISILYVQQNFIQQIAG